jgi:hypothetical protein
MARTVIRYAVAVKAVRRALTRQSKPFETYPSIPSGCGDGIPETAKIHRLLAFTISLFIFLLYSPVIPLFSETRPNSMPYQAIEYGLAATMGVSRRRCRQIAAIMTRAVQGNVILPPTAGLLDTIAMVAIDTAGEGGSHSIGVDHISESGAR